VTAATALIVRVQLPRRLETIRRRAVPDSDLGIPAHITMMYPFVPPGALDTALREKIAAVTAAHAPISYRIAGPAQWPDTLYASVAPEAPFHNLQADLAAAFPAYPLYGGAFDFVPHVTIADGEPRSWASLAHDPAWAALPASRTARSVELIVQTPDGWRVKCRFLLRQPTPQ
jgi:2'-5' RNA ligase